MKATLKQAHPCGTDKMVPRGTVLDGSKGPLDDDQIDRLCRRGHAVPFDPKRKQKVTKEIVPEKTK